MIERFLTLKKIGPDSATHMCTYAPLTPFVGHGILPYTFTAEEIKDASRVLPLAMMGTAILNGVLGYVMLISYLTCMGNVEEVMDSPTGFAFIQVFYNSTQSRIGASVMTTILIILTVCGTISNVATASRQMFAFARDKGMPFSSFLAYVSAPSPLFSQ